MYLHPALPLRIFKNKTPCRLLRSEQGASHRPSYPPLSKRVFGWSSSRSPFRSSQWPERWVRCKDKTSNTAMQDITLCLSPPWWSMHGEGEGGKAERFAERPRGDQELVGAGMSKEHDEHGLTNLVSKLNFLFNGQGSKPGEEGPQSPWRSPSCGGTWILSITVLPYTHFSHPRICSRLPRWGLCISSGNK